MRVEKEFTLTKWRFDKSISLPTLGVVAVQSLAAAWWLSAWQTKTDLRISQLEQQNVASAWQAEKIIRLDEGMKNLQLGIGEIKLLLQQERGARDVRDQRRGE